jgi:hypothetical protein
MKESSFYGDELKDQPHEAVMPAFQGFPQEEMQQQNGNYIIRHPRTSAMGNSFSQTASP